MMAVGAFRAPLSLSQPRVRCGGARTKRAGGGGGTSSGFGGVAEAMTWRCAPGCGACCKLDKGPAFPTPEEIFHDNPTHLQLYKSLIGPDGWCVHYQHATRTCSIYPDRPFFCRVKPDVFRELFGIDERTSTKRPAAPAKTPSRLFMALLRMSSRISIALYATPREVTTASRFDSVRQGYKAEEDSSIGYQV